MNEKGKIVNQGMGGFLNPPTHPEHDWSVESVKRHDFSMSLTCAVSCEYLDEETKDKAFKILKDWKKPKLKSQEVQGWIYQVMGYFRNCYQGEDGSWKAGELTVDSKLDPMLNQDIHAGVHFIRRFYPGFKLKQSHLDNAYWGEK